MKIPGIDNEIALMEYIAPAVVAQGGILDTLNIKLPLYVHLYLINIG